MAVLTTGLPGCFKDSQGPTGGADASVPDTSTSDLPDAFAGTPDAGPDGTGDAPLDGVADAIPVDAGPGDAAADALLADAGSRDAGADVATIDAAPPAPTSCMGGSGGADTTCGSSGNSDCCASPLVVGGSFARENDSTQPATISDFRLDAYEVTVGRFRQFLVANGGNVAPPAAGAGANPHLANSGWDPSWNTNLPGSRATLDDDLTNQCNVQSFGSTAMAWTTSPGGNEHLPINCLSWYLAFAFCAWDGGRLPTNAELNYAEAGGAEQRVFPWSAAADAGVDAGVADLAHANYGCPHDGGTNDLSLCGLGDLLPVGSLPLGAGKFGQMDLSGNVFEWVLDWDNATDGLLPCNDCAQLIPTDAGNDYRRSRSYALDSTQAQMATDSWGIDWPAAIRANAGVRCAR